MPLSRDAILQAEDLETREVPVPEWGGSVLVKALSGKERDAYEASLVQIRGKETVPNVANVRAKLVARCLVDAEGKRVFTDSDINALGQKSAAVLDRLFEVTAEISGIRQADVEELAGNSDAAQSGDSISVWPETLDALSPNSSHASRPAN